MATYPTAGNPYSRAQTQQGQGYNVQTALGQSIPNWLSQNPGYTPTPPGGYFGHPMAQHSFQTTPTAPSQYLPGTPGGRNTMQNPAYTAWYNQNMLPNILKYGGMNVALGDLMAGAPAGSVPYNVPGAPPGYMAPGGQISYLGGPLSAAQQTAVTYQNPATNGVAPNTLPSQWQPVPGGGWYNPSTGGYYGPPGNNPNKAA